MRPTGELQGPRRCRRCCPRPRQRAWGKLRQGLRPTRCAAPSVGRGMGGWGVQVGIGVGREAGSQAAGVQARRRGRGRGEGLRRAGVWGHRVHVRVGVETNGADGAMPWHRGAQSVGAGVGVGVPDAACLGCRVPWLSYCSAAWWCSAWLGRDCPTPSPPSTSVPCLPRHPPSRRKTCVRGGGGNRGAGLKERSPHPHQRTQHASFLTCGGRSARSCGVS